MNVLFVDDDVDDREFFIDALSYVNNEITCHLAHDCNQAFEILLKMDDLPKYVFLDINMPDMDGMGCLARLKNESKFSAIKIVMYSNSSDEKVMEAYKKVGATYFLVKPPTFKDLCDSLALMLDT
jgi:CheY-like chemotaxis protein